MSILFHYNEDHVSQKPAIALLKEIGYTYLSPEEALELRGGKTTNVLLEDILRKQLKKINSIKVSSTVTSFFSDANIENGIMALKELPLHEGYIVACQIVYDRIILGKTLEQSLDGDRRSFTMQYIDWENPANNVFHVTEEYSVMRTGSKEHYRPDIVLFVNGIPLCIIECKRPDIKEPIEEAISQHIRNQHEDGIRPLYVYSQLLMAIATVKAKYGTTDTKAEYWGIWKEDKDIFENPHIDLKSEQDRYLYFLCRPERLLELTRDYIIFEGGKFKKIARYQQFFSVQKMLKRIMPLSEGKRHGGVIWHTQGSGKSLTMAMLARKITHNIHNPKIVVVTDRVSLDTQITNTFKRVQIPVHNANTGNKLVELLQSNNDAVITTIINKFEAAVNQLGKTPLTNPNIFVLIDEGHRTQYGRFNVKMQRVLPNACFLAFTGTPLMKDEKNTARKFGGIIDAYTINQAVEDKAIVPIIYEGRMTEQDVNQKGLDKGFENVSEPLDKYQRTELKKKFSKSDLIEKTEQRIDIIAWDISEHFAKTWGADKTGEKSGFKGMLVATDKETAIKYKTALDLIGKITSEVIISSPDDRVGHEDVHEPPSEKVQQWWKGIKQKYGYDYEKNMLNQFKNTDYPDLLIVVHKLLTGFDEPRVVVMYICRKLYSHTLLQAIARVNRVYEGKDYGYVIDYAGVLGELDEAMNTYTNLEDFDRADLEGTLTDIKEVIKKLPETLAELTSIFKSLVDIYDLVACTNLLADNALRDEFYEKFRIFAKYMKIAYMSIDYENNTPENEKTKYANNLKYFTTLRNAVVNAYSDKVDFKKYEKQLQKLLDQHVTTQEVIRLTEQVSILDAEAFGQEVEKVVGKRAQAETIASRTTKYINENIDEDPVFYKKLSELIRQTISELRAKRLSEVEALKRLNEYKEQAISKKSDDVPQNMYKKEEAIPFYRLALQHKDLNSGQAESFAMATDEIVRKYIVVDWTQKLDVMRKINFYIGEFLIDEYKMPIEEAEELAQQCLEVAKKRYPA